jgi:mevalonate kinase
VRPAAAPSALPAAVAPAAAASGQAAVTVSVPGKLILMGEHAAVYGRPALIAAIDLRLTARFSAPGGKGAAPQTDQIHLDLPCLGARGDLTWEEVRRYARQAAASWGEYARQLDAASFRRMCGSDPLHLVKVGLGEAAAALGQVPDPPLQLRIDSELPIGSGFGSSAAAAVAIVAGYFAWRGGRLEARSIERLAMEVERRQHGLPSGVDTVATLHGGLLWAQRLASGEMASEQVSARSPLLGRLRVYDTGTPPEPTGAVVAAVRERQGRAPERHDRLFDRMTAATHALRGEIEQAGEEPARVVALIREHEACLEELGVVPAAVRELVRRVESEGGAAKISGAGSLAGPGGGSLLVYHADAERAAGWSFLAPLRHFTVRLGAPGLQVEIA